MHNLIQYCDISHSEYLLTGNYSQLLPTANLSPISLKLTQYNHYCCFLGWLAVGAILSHLNQLQLYIQSLFSENFIKKIDPVLTNSPTQKQTHT